MERTHEMSARKAIEYSIAVVCKPPHKEKARGYPINLPVEGTYAVRDNKRGWWIVDHIETGFCVCMGESRQEAIDNAMAIVKAKGPDGFAKAIKKAHGIIKRRNIQ